MHQSENNEQETTESKVPPIPLPLELPVPPLPPREKVMARQEQERARYTLTMLFRQNAGTDQGGLPFALLLSAPLWAVLMLFAISTSHLLLALPPLFVLVMAVKMGNMSGQLAQARIALQLTEANSYWIGPCIEALEWPAVNLRGIATNLLIRLLPSMTPDILQSLPSERRAALYARLTKRMAKQETALVLAILKAIRQTRDLSATPYLESLATGFAWTVNLKQVKAAASECLLFLEAEEAKERTSQKAVAPEQESGLVSEADAAEATRVQKLLDQMEAERRTHRKPQMRSFFLAANWMIIFPYCLYQFLCLIGETTNWWELPLWGLGAFSSTQMYRFSLSSKQTETARRLAQYDSVRAVGPLTEALEWPDSEVQAIVSEALTRLLPRLKASDANLLNSKQRAILYKQLRPMNANRRSSLICAILRGLEQAGDKSALPPVTRLAQMPVLTPGQRKVRLAAQRCLEYLDANAENARSSQMLLRASSPMPTSPDMLLRPASGGNETAQEQLLRASQSEE